MINQNTIFDITTIQNRCADCSLRELCLPRGLCPEELTRLETIIKRQRFIQRNSHLFREGDKFTHIYVIRSGSVKAYKMTFTGKEEILGFYLPGEILGLDAIQDEYHHCSIVAMESTSCCSISFPELEEVCLSILGLQHQLHKLMSREISQENEHMLLLGNKTASEKVASFLVNLSMRYQALGYSSTEFRLPMSHQDAAHYLGLTSETFSRVFAQLRKENIIHTEKGFISIVDNSRLREVCEA